MSKVYGPYTRKDNRQHVVVVEDDGSKRTVSYPKYLMEQHLGRKLHPDLETVDHIDGDFTNNSISNLRIVDRSTHSREDAKYSKEVTLTCVFCGREFRSKDHGDKRASKKKGHAGPFCGKSCVGKYTQALKAKKLEPLDNNWNVSVEYYKTEKT